MLIPCTKNIKSSASVTDGWKELESRDNNIPLFPVIWSQALVSITYVQGKDEVKQVVDLPVWARVNMEEDGTWAVWNCCNIWNY